MRSKNKGNNEQIQRKIKSNEKSLANLFMISGNHVMVPLLWREAHMCTVYGIDSRFTKQCNVVFYVYADLCSLLAATSQFSILTGQKMQLTGAIMVMRCVIRHARTLKFQLSGPIVHSLYCGTCVYCDSKSKQNTGEYGNARH